MSSFNINGPSNNQPIIQSSQNLGKDGGGGGNTGYMNMRKRKKGSKPEEDNSVFLEEEIEDTFEKQGKKPAKKGNRLIGAIQNFVKDKKSPKEKDSFIRQPKEKTAEEAEEDDFSEYNIPLKKTVDPLEDDEYEVVEDDYYDDVDV